MSRHFDFTRKPKKISIKNKENLTLIKAIEMYGRVPEEWELLDEIERLNNIIKTKDEGFKASIEELTDYANRIDKALEYIKEYLYINEETGEYCLTHTFDSSNLYELMKILKENKV